MHTYIYIYIYIYTAQCVATAAADKLGHARSVLAISVRKIRNRGSQIPYPISQYIKLCVRPYRVHHLLSGKWYMQEFNAPGSGRKFKQRAFEDWPDFPRVLTRRGANQGGANQANSLHGLWSALTSRKNRAAVGAKWRLLPYMISGSLTCWLYCMPCVSHCRGMF